MSSTAAEDSSGTKPKHVLVVDDDVDLAQAFRELLQVYDYHASVAPNGLQALKLIAETEVDAVVCDLSMPQMTGDLFYEEVSRLQPQLSRRFVFVTGNSGNPKFEPFLAKVECPVLYKPVTVDKLLSTLAGVLKRPLED
jgi:CheY-like chemotaxis protein